VTLAESEAWLHRWFGEKAPGQPLSPDENYFDAGVIDSFEVIELIEAIESHFGIVFTDVDFQDRRFPTLAGLSVIVTEKMKNGSNG